MISKAEAAKLSKYTKTIHQLAKECEGLAKKNRPFEGKLFSTFVAYVIALEAWDKAARAAKSQPNDKVKAKADAKAGMKVDAAETKLLAVIEAVEAGLSPDADGELVKHTVFAAKKTVAKKVAAKKPASKKAAKKAV